MGCQVISLHGISKSNWGLLSSGGTSSATVIVENGHSDQVQILDEAVYNANILGKGIHSIILPLPMGK